MTSLRSLCVYCGSRSGPHDSFGKLAEDFGRIMAKQGIELVYGGGSVGIMGSLARAVAADGGKVIAVIPEHLDHVEIGNRQADEYHVVDDMHVRKRTMFERADGFVILPGGLGTLDEMIEVITWAQLGLHSKPVVLANHQGYWEPFLKLVEHVIDENFATPEISNLYQVVERVDDIIPALESYEYRPPLTLNQLIE